MNKELQDLAWSVLPKEFKEEVKKDYQYALKNRNRSDLQRGASDTLEHFFGLHNLTSDAEGEEMLTCEKSKVVKLYNKFQKDGTFACLYAAGVLDTLFDSKCLPDEKEFAKNANCKEPQPAKPFKVGDKVIYHPFKSNSFYNAEVLEIRDKEDKPYLLHLEDAENIWAYPIEVQSIAETYPQEPKPAEPKFKVGDKVRCTLNSKVYCIKGRTGKYHYALSGWNHNIHEDYLEPYTKPTEENSPNVNHPDIDISELVAKGYVLDPAKQLDTILKDGFSKERRLNIAAIIAGGMAFNWCIEPQGGNLRDKCHRLAKLSLMVTDTLITESEKGGTDEN